MEEGYLFVSSVSDGSALGVVADRRCDVGAVGYQMTLLVDRVGADSVAAIDPSEPFVEAARARQAWPATRPGRSAWSPSAGRRSRTPWSGRTI